MGDNGGEDGYEGRGGSGKEVLGEGAHVSGLAETLAAGSASPAEMAALLGRQGRSAVPKETLRMLAGIALHQPGMLRALNVDPEWLERTITRSMAAEKFEEMSGDEKRALDRQRWVKWLLLYRERVESERADHGTPAHERREMMVRSNPWLVLRNWVAQEAIEAAEAGDYGHVEKLLSLLMDPTRMPEDLERKFRKYADPPKPSMADICVTCSS